LTEQGDLRQVQCNIFCDEGLPQKFGGNKFGGNKFEGFACIL
jgi:hypothetical protein